MSTQHDLSPNPPARTFLPVAEWEAELAEAERAARGLLAELAAVEDAAPPPGNRASLDLGRKLRLALDYNNPVTLPQAIARVHGLADEIRVAIVAARAWADEVEAERAALVEALNADAAVRKARAALAAAHKGAAALTARLQELRRDLAALGDAPASVEAAGAWAQQRAALQGEIAAVAGLEDDARRPLGPAQAALTAAEADVLKRLQDAAGAQVEAARQEWGAALERVNVEGAARLEGATRVASALTTARRGLK
jgi:hypothetical protein